MALHIEGTVRPLIAKRPPAREAFALRDETIVGEDSCLLAILELVGRVAPTAAPVLVSGETGTGKELVAREVHARSLRRDKPYVTINCAAIPDTLGESELFGHAAGAFTGAIGRKRGKFEAADGGTLFLDEIGEMSPALQAKLLRVLQNGEFSVVGEAQDRFCDVRIVAASNQHLESLVHDGRFRSDLYYRLNVIHVELPPLRDRRGDVLALARHFATRFAESYGLAEPRLAPDLADFLLHYDFPGNVRELENIIHRAVVLSHDGWLSTATLPEEHHRPPESALLEEAVSFHEVKQAAVERFEREYLVAMLKDCGGIIRRAAVRAGLSERNFHAKLARYGIDGQAYRAPARAGR